jgi:hypothetical protein
MEKKLSIIFLIGSGIFIVAGICFGIWVDNQADNYFIYGLSLPRDICFYQHVNSIWAALGGFLTGMSLTLKPKILPHSKAKPNTFPIRLVGIALTTISIISLLSLRTEFLMILINLDAIC